MRATPAGAPDAGRFLQLAGHPLRWRLLTELGLSDRRVGELAALVQEPQNLVSYHLGQLRAARLVSARRSSADRRDLYYTVDLGRFGDLLALTGQTLHPGLRLAAAGPDDTPSTNPVSANPVSANPVSAGAAPAPRLLFLCTGNSARSQMAEALVRARSGGRVQAFSAGSKPKPVHPNAVRVMREAGIDLSSRQSKHVSVFAEDSFDYVITLCDRVREVCPEFPGHPGYVHWSIADPAASGGRDDQTYPLFKQLAAELQTRIGYLLAVLADRPAQEAR